MECKNAKKTVKFALILFAFLANGVICGQSILAPVLKSTDLSNSPTTVCVSESNKTFSATAQITSPGFAAGTIFSLQLSNPNGTFGSGTLILATTTASGNDLLFDSFDLPENDGTGEPLDSDSYRLKVIIENTTTESTRSRELSMYFYDLSIEYSLLPREGFCELANAELTAANELDSYLWYKLNENGSGAQLLTGVTGSTFKPTEVGTYYYTPDFGICPDLINGLRSNNVTVQNITNTITVNIIAEGSTNICASESVVLRSDFTDPSYNYQWTKDGKIISGETSTFITITGIEAEGNYNILVSENTGTLNSRCAFKSDDEIFIDLRNPTIKITSELNIVDIPGQDEILTAQLGETPQGSQVITWIKDGVEVPNSNTLNFTATGPGKYKVKVVDNSSSCDIKEMTSVEEVTIIPVDNLDVVIVYDNPAYTDCNFNQIALRVSSVSALVNGENVDLPPSSFESLQFRWFKNNIDTGRSGTTIFINTASDNGTYKAVVTGASGDFDSNELSVLLSLGSLTIQASPPQLTLGGTSELSVNLPDGAILSDYTFQWQRGVAIPLQGETQPTYTVTNPGTYSVLVSFTGCNQELVGPVSLQTGSNVIPNVLSRNSDPFNNNWEVPALIKNNPEYSVEIYTANGKLDFKSGPQGYSGEWPEESQSNLNGTIYYYVISKDDSVLEKGSITIIR